MQTQIQMQAYSCRFRRRNRLTLEGAVVSGHFGQNVYQDQQRRRVATKGGGGGGDIILSSVERPEFNPLNHFRAAIKDGSVGVLLQTAVVPCW